MTDTGKNLMKSKFSKPGQIVQEEEVKSKEIFKIYNEKADHKKVKPDFVFFAPKGLKLKEEIGFQNLIKTKR